VREAASKAKPLSRCERTLQIESLGVDQQIEIRGQNRRSLEDCGYRPDDNEPHVVPNEGWKDFSGEER